MFIPWVGLSESANPGLSDSIPLYSLTGVVRRFWPSLPISSAKESVNNSAGFAIFDSDPVTNKSLKRVATLKSQYLAQGRSLPMKPRILRYGRPTSRTIRPAAFIFATQPNHYDDTIQSY